MRLARKKLKCPECDEYLVGLVQKIITTNARCHDEFQTEWICESCDEAYMYVKRRGKMKLLPAYEVERAWLEEECLLPPQPAAPPQSAARCNALGTNGLVVGSLTNNQRRYKVAASKKERPVLVTTAHRGVFFGYATDTSGETVKITNGRCCVYWTQDVRGFVGLAATGPKKGCRVGPKADMELRNVTAILECTPEAVEAWESGLWS